MANSGPLPTFVASLGDQLKLLLPEELAAIGPDLVAFWQWLEANPVPNLKDLVIQATALEAKVIAAQPTVLAEQVKMFAASQISLIQSLMAANPVAKAP